jgi:hypothetical protein
VREANLEQLKALAFYHRMTLKDVLEVALSRYLRKERTEEALEVYTSNQREVRTMPYADPERRRQFQRLYKRKLRKTQEKINPLRAFRVYVCPRFPSRG